MNEAYASSFNWAVMFTLTEVWRDKMYCPVNEEGVPETKRPQDKSFSAIACFDPRTAFTSMNTKFDNPQCGYSDPMKVKF